MQKFSYIYVLLFTVPMFWGTSYSAGKIAMLELAPLNLEILRMGLASLIFLVALIVKKKNNTIERSDIPRFFIIGFMAITAFFYIHLSGLEYTTSTNAGLIMATTPVFAALFSTAIGLEKVTFMRTAGILTAFAGVCLIITKGHFAGLLSFETLRGDGLILVTALIWAGFTLYGTTLMQKYSPFVAIAYTHICGTILLLPFAFVENPFVAVPLLQEIGRLSWQTLMVSVYLAAFCSVYAYYMWYVGVEKVGAVRTAVFNYFNPVFAVITGVILLGETPSSYVLFGGILVISGVYLTNRQPTKQQDRLVTNSSDFCG